MHGDDVAPDLETIELRRGSAVVCCRRDHRFAAMDVVPVDLLFEGPFVAMRPGYLMHRYIHRLVGDRPIRLGYFADGAEMGKLMVAQGLGVTVLPDYSVVADPLEKNGTLVIRPLDTDDAAVVLVAQRRRARYHSDAMRVLDTILRDGAANHPQASYLRPRHGPRSRPDRPTSDHSRSGVLPRARNGGRTRAADQRTARQGETHSTQKSGERIAVVGVRYRPPTVVPLWYGNPALAPHTSDPPQSG